MKKHVFLIGSLCLLLSAVSFGQSARKYYKAGTEFIGNFKYDDAIAQFTSAIGLEPSNPDYYYARGQAYDNISKFDDAIADYEKALVFDPKSVDAVIALGSDCNKTEKFERALSLLNYASGLDKRNEKIYPEKVITLIALQKYDQALKVSDTTLKLKENPLDYYYRGVIYRKLNNELLSKSEFEKAIAKNKSLIIARLALADLLINNNPMEAMNQCNQVLSFDDRNTDAYSLRSEIFKKNLDYPNAINDVSKNISLKPDNPDVYFARAKSYEGLMNYDKAIEDYTKITALSEFDGRALKMLKEAKARLFELNRESDPPEITVMNPVPVKDTIELRGDKPAVLISGFIKDKSKIKSLLINNGPVTINEKNGGYEFFSNIDVTSINNIKIAAIDDYGNEKVLNYIFKRTEINPPLISVIAPYSSEGEIFLDSTTPNIAIQGKISDQSLIKSISIGDVTASYNRNELNPGFSANLDVSNLTKVTVIAEDIYGNRQETEFKLNREGTEISANNPMGRTWVVFIENSSYETFASLDGPIKDVSTIQRALANYQIHQIIHKKDMTKEEMERYFNIELRDAVKKNQVKSLMVWYAGHGKFINDIGYWIPVDAKRDDEFTYFNINSLKAGLQGYTDVVVHTLVVSDACESGPGFYTAMRAGITEPKCDNSLVAGAKSSQVFSSAGYELATDNSKFTATFANTLMNNKNACIPIETIVKSVTAAVATDKGQKPKFGKIQGLDDMNGTFFFIAK